MKKKLTFIIVLIVIFAIFSCKKSGTNNNNLPVYPMSAHINGATFNCVNCIAVRTGTPNNGPVYIYGWGTDTGTVVAFPYIYFGLSYPVLRGLHYLTLPNSHYGGPGGLDSASNYQRALYGTIIITDTFPKIMGTFNFTTIDSTKVTNGSFSAKVP